MTGRLSGRAGSARGISALLCLALSFLLISGTHTSARADYVQIHDRTFLINGYSVPLEGLEPGVMYENCFEFAEDAYTRLWGGRFSEFRDSEDDMLRELTDDKDRTLTAEHLRAFVTAAEIGAVMRLCNWDCLYGGDLQGHNQIILDKDENGLTVYEGNIGIGIVEISRYTWETYIALWPQYDYIKYVKWPGAEPFAARYAAATCPYATSYTVDALAGQGCKAWTLPWNADACSLSRKEPVARGTAINVIRRVQNSAGELWYETAQGWYLPVDSVSVEYLRDCRIRPEHGTGVVCAGKARMWSLPCHDGTDGRSRSLGELSRGDRVTVSAAVINTLGCQWLEVTDAAGVTGYVFAPRIAIPVSARYTVTGITAMYREVDGDSQWLDTLWRDSRVTVTEAAFDGTGGKWFRLTSGGYVRAARLQWLETANPAADRSELQYDGAGEVQ